MPLTVTVFGPGIILRTRVVTIANEFSFKRVTLKYEVFGCQIEDV